MDLVNDYPSYVLLLHFSHLDLHSLEVQAWFYPANSGKYWLTVKVSSYTEQVLPSTISDQNYQNFYQHYFQPTFYPAELHPFPTPEISERTILLRRKVCQLSSGLEASSYLLL